MKVLVTGVSGFIGQHIVPILLNQGHKVLGVSREIDKAKKFEWFSDIDFISCDIYKIDKPMLELFASQDAIVHLSWPGLPNFKSLYHFEKNLNSDYIFLKSLVKMGLKQILVTGTCVEYGMQTGALSEDLKTDPFLPYAIAKDSLHRFLIALQSENSFVLQWARLFYMYGKGQDVNSLLSQVNNAVNNNQTVFNMSNGDQLRDYLPVEEVARRLVILIENPDKSGTINICKGSPMSVLELVKSHIKTNHFEIELNTGYFPYPDYEPLNFWGLSEFFDDKGNLND